MHQPQMNPTTFHRCIRRTMRASTAAGSGAPSACRRAVCISSITQTASTPPPTMTVANRAPCATASETSDQNAKRCNREPCNRHRQRRNDARVRSDPFSCNELRYVATHAAFGQLTTVPPRPLRLYWHWGQVKSCRISWVSCSPRCVITEISAAQRQFTFVANWRARAAVGRRQSYRAAFDDQAASKFNVHTFQIANHHVNSRCFQF